MGPSRVFLSFQGHGRYGAAAGTRPLQLLFAGVGPHLDLRHRLTWPGRHPSTISSSSASRRSGFGPSARPLRAVLLRWCLPFPQGCPGSSCGTPTTLGAMLATGFFFFDPHSRGARSIDVSAERPRNRVDRLHALAEFGDSLAIMLEFAVGQIPHLQVRNSAECWPVELIADVLLARVGSHQEKPLQRMRFLAQCKIQHADDSGIDRCGMPYFVGSDDPPRRLVEPQRIDKPNGVLRPTRLQEEEELQGRSAELPPRLRWLEATQTSYPIARPRSCNQPWISVCV